MDITEFEKLDPDRLDAVGSPANGVGFLLLKSVDTDDEFVKGLCGDTGCAVCAARYRALPADALGKARMKAKERHALDDSDFAFPDDRKEPLNDEAHVRNAISRFSQVEGVSAADRKKAARRILAAAHKYGIDVSDDSDVARAAKQTAPDKAVPEAEGESQTRECDTGPQGPVPSPDNEDRGEPKHIAFPHGPEGDGQGDTAPDKGTRQGEACAQTRDNVEGNGAGVSSGPVANPDTVGKADVDMTGSKPESEDLHEDEAESQTDDNVEGNAGKADADSSPGSSAWEHKDVALGERAEQLCNELTEVVRAFTDREKAEGGASKQLRRAARTARSLLNNQTQLRKAVKEMPDTNELAKVLGEYDKARRAEKKARKEKDAKKAAKAAAKAAKAAGADEVQASENDKRIADLQKQIEAIAAEDGRRVAVNGAGVTAVLRGPEAETAFKAFDDRVEQAEAAFKAASGDYAVTRAKAELEAAKGARTRAKLVAQANAQKTNPALAGRFGPNSTDLFGGTSLTLPEDHTLKGF